MNNIRRAQAIADRVARGEENFGRVGLKHDGDYVLLNYTNEAMRGRKMSAVEKACRGMVVRTDGKLMALPMPKFFNVGEPQCPPLPDRPHEIWEKIDGSLGIFWHDGEGWRCNTRGSFENEYTEFAQNWWVKYVDHEAIQKHWTVMAEICIDDDVNPRAAYHPEGLYLIAVRDTYSGADLSLTARPVNECKGFLWPHCWGSLTLDELLKKDWKSKKEGTEGWTIRYDNGLRVKVKTAWYLRMFRAMVSMRPNRIRDLMVEAGKSWIDEFPDDLRPEAAAMQTEIEEAYRSELKRIYGAYSRIAGVEPRKDFALIVRKHYPGIAHWLFALRDGRFNELDVLKRMEV